MTIKKPTTISISTYSSETLQGILEIDCGNRLERFEIDEELAHRLCSDLDRFLTQVPRKAAASKRR